MDRLGVEEWCRRLELLEPKRAPLFAEREVLQARQMQLAHSWQEWVEANEALLPPPLREIRVEERRIDAEFQRIEAEMNGLWRETMDPPSSSGGEPDR